MTNILIITCSYDKTVDYIIDRYKNDADFFRFNVDSFADYRITITQTSWKITYGNYSITKDTVSSIYYRKPSFPDVSGFALEYQNMIKSDILALIDGIVNSFDGTVLTKPYLLRRAENKIFQLIYVQNKSILVPDSFIGNSNGWTDIEKQKIIKPVSVGKIETLNGSAIIQTNLMHENDEYDSLELTPIYIQEYLHKSFEVRITVIDNDYYAVKIISDNNIDWRAGDNNQYELIDIPADVKNTIRTMMNDFQLRFGAFDYIVDNNGKWYFLEINPNGQWQWLECILGVSISSSIMKILLGG